MKLFGFYPFNVQVLNMFDPILEVSLFVSLYQYRSYYCPAWQKDGTEKGGAIITEITSPNSESNQSNLSPCQIVITGGHCIVFPMQFGDERVEICLADSSKIGYNYTISVGATAICQLREPGDNGESLNKKDGVEFTESIFEESKPPIIKEGLNSIGDDYHVGGKWKILTSYTGGWVLEIKKYTFDPEEVSVSVGPQVPG